MSCVLALVALATQNADPVEVYVENILQQTRVPGAAVLIAQKGKPDRIFTKGKAQIAEDKAITDDMVFDCGSMGKMFTATALMRLVEEGKISLDTTLGELVPNAHKDWHPATLQQLLSHTAGLPEYVLYEGIRLTDDWETPKFFEVMADKPLDYPPGTEFQYSNTNFYMAQLMAEKATGKPWSELLQTYVFQPAGMKETGHLLTAEDIEKRKAQGYWIAETVDTIPPIGKAPDFGSGRHFTTVRDVKLFAQALFGGKLVKPETLKKMTANAPLPKGRKAPYGLGLFTREVNGLHLWSHGGNSVGYAGSMTYLPEKETTVIVLANAYQMSGDGVARGIATQLFPELAPTPLTESTDPDKSRSEKLISVLKDMAKGELTNDLMSEELKSRLARPRGQLSLQSYGIFQEATYDAYMGSESDAPDTIVRIRVKAAQDQRIIAHFTLDSDGKVFQISLSRA